MKVKLIAVAFVTLAVSSAYAILGQYAPRFYFQTFGCERYADGTSALDGECYALVWQRDGVDFKGFNATGTIGYGEDATLPVDSANCRVIAVFPEVTKEWAEADPESGIEEDGWLSSCYGAHVAVDRDFYALHYSGGGEPGTFSVYLLDTRICSGDETVVGGYDAANKTVPVLNGYGVVSYLETIDMIPGSDSVPIDTQGDSFDYESAIPSYGDIDPTFEIFLDTFVTTASAIPVDAPQPCVSAFVRGDGVVTLSVTNTASYLRYNVTGASELGELLSTTNLLGTAKQGGGVLTWTIPAPGVKGFYKVIRQPLVEPGR